MRFNLLVACAFFLITPSAFATDRYLDIQKVTSEKGLDAWLVEDHSIPIIAVEFSFKGAGAKNNPADKQGLARLVSNTMDEGAGNLTSQAFQEILKNQAISLYFSTSRDNFGGSVKTLTKNKNQAFELLRLALTKPRFDEEPLKRMRLANQSRIKSSLSNPKWIAARIKNDRIFEGHNYALNSGGTLSSLAEITQNDLRAFHKTLGKNNLVIGVSGDITAAELAILLDDVFGTIPDVKSPTAKKFELQNTGKTYLYKQEIPQSIIEISQKGISRKNPDYYAAKLMNFILGESGFGSRLMEEAREKRGLTYGVYSYFREYSDIETLNISTSTANKSTKEMLGIINAQWDKMKNTTVSEQEIKDAKSYLIGSLPLSFTSSDAIAGILLSLQLDDLPINYFDTRKEKLEKITISDIQSVAQKLLDKNSFTTILIGNPQNIENAQIITKLPNVE